MPEENYVIYAYHDGKKRGKIFYDLSSTRLEKENHNLVRYVDGVSFDVAERICRNTEFDLETEMLVISTLLFLSDDSY